MYFEKITIRNFLSFGNHTEELILDNHNLTQCIGKNGAGKSSFWNAVAFALFGQTIKGLKKNEIPNNINKKDCLVTIHFKKNSNSYVVERGLSPNIFKIYKNDELIPQISNVYGYQEMLERDILGYNFELFKQLIVLSGHHFTPFFKMNTGKRREILEELLSLKELGEMEKVLKGYIAENKSATKTSRALLVELTSLIKRQNELLKKSKEKAEQKITQINSQVNEKQDRVSMLNDDIESMKNILVQDNIDVQKLQAEIAEINEKIAQNKKKISDFKTLVKHHDKTIHYLENHTSCSTCQQDISEDFKIKAISKTKNDISYLLENAAEFETLNETYQSKLNSLNDTFEDVKRIAISIKNTQSQIQNLQSEISILQEQIQTDDEDISDSIKEELKQLSERYLNLQDEINSLADKSELYDTAKRILSDDGVRKTIINKYIPFITSRINHWLNELELFATVTISDTFEEEIKMRGFDTVRFESCSMGEQTRLTLATVFAFRELLQIRNNEISNLLMLDEVIGNLDVDGQYKLLKSLKGICRENDVSIFVVSHSNLDEEAFDSNIVMTKQANFTTLSIS